MSKKKDYYSYKGMGEAYKNAKKEPILNEDDYISSKKKKKKKKNKRSEHKHEYVPAIYTREGHTYDGKPHTYVYCGSHCKICGRVKNFMLTYSRMEDRIARFKEQYPNYVEITLPDSWSYFKDKCIPI